jgi:hypothetical protein
VIERGGRPHGGRPPAPGRDSGAGLLASAFALVNEHNGGLHTRRVEKRGTDEIGVVARPSLTGTTAPFGA